MNPKDVRGLITAVALGFFLGGCGDTREATPGSVPSGGGATIPRGPAPTFTLAWSEYPSWSVFGVASDRGLIDGKKGKLGRIEEKWGVDIELQLLQYEPCITAYQSKASDAVCITNMDVLNPALSRKSVAIMPTSTSNGADACIVVGIPDLKELRKHKVFGLPESVSQYAFVRCLEVKGEKEADYQYSQMDPEKAALAMQAKTSGVDAIMVWNPFVLQTLKSRKDARVLFDSSLIPEEIIDMIVVGQDVLERPHGKEFAWAVADTYYEFNKMLADPKERDGLLVALGEKFSSLNRDEMEKAVTQTRFYKTPEEGLGLLTGEKFRMTMGRIVDFYVSRGIIKGTPPTLNFGEDAKPGGAQLRFDPSFIRMVQERK
jgi:ABC-type nitrate/sulfonate/bicarbonate transport system substrate-binding protein